MHQETLLYMWHRLPLEKKIAPAGIPQPVLGGQAPARATVRVPAGIATLGAKREEIPFGWDNEFDEHVVDVPAFEVDVYDVTNRDFLEFVREGGYERRGAVVRGGLGLEGREQRASPAHLGAAGQRLDLARDVRHVSRFRPPGPCS